MSKKTWDMGVGYEELKRRIILSINNIRNKEGLKATIRLAYLIVYAIQLRNGSRISEAVEGFNKFLNNKYSVKNGRKVVEVKVRKKKTEDMRLLIYPEFIPFVLLEKVKRYRVEVNEVRAKVYAKRILGVNTHTLRYARITYLLEKGVNPSIVAKITHHSKLDFILNYTQEKVAEKVNYELI